MTANIHGIGPDTDGGPNPDYRGEPSLASTWKGRADRLRAALVGLVGVDGKEELEQMEAVMRLLPGPAADKAVTIDAIQALLSTLPNGTQA